MGIKEMIEVLQAAERGEKIEVLKERFDPREIPDHTDVWKPIVGPVLFNMPMDRYRIAPKKVMTLVEKLRAIHSSSDVVQIIYEAADRIEELEEILNENVYRIDNDLLMSILQKRLRKC